jgi:cell division protein FtsL
MGSGKVFLVLMLAVALAMLHLAIYTQNINSKYDVEDLKRALGKLQVEVRELSSRASEKEDLKRIESIAKGKLGMIRPSGIIYIVPPATQEIPLEK